MTEQREAEIRARAVLIARRHVHADQATQQEREAVKAVLRSEGLDEGEAVFFWSVYDAEEQDTRKALSMDDQDWRWRGENIALFLLGEDGLTVRDVRRPSVETAAKIRVALAANPDWQRLPARRKAEVDALAVDGAFDRLKTRCAGTPLWRDLGAVLATEADRGEAQRGPLVRAAQVAGRAVLELGSQPWNGATAAVENVFSGRSLFQLRYQLRYQSPLIKKTSEYKAAMAAADALCHMLRAAEDGDLAVQVPAAWASAHRAITEAYDGPGRATRLNALRLGILAELPEALRDALGISPDIECELRARAELRRAS